MKNVIVRYMCGSADLENTLPVPAQALQMTACEVEEIRATRPGIVGELVRAFRPWR